MAPGVEASGKAMLPELLGQRHRPGTKEAASEPVGNLVIQTAQQAGVSNAGDTGQGVMDLGAVLALLFSLAVRCLP